MLVTGTKSAALESVLLLRQGQFDKVGHAMLRGFTDSNGVEWRVWEVLPASADVASVDSFARSLSNTPFANGWLCFESAHEKRRLAPIPPAWHSRETDVLKELCSRATVVLPLRRYQTDPGPSATASV